MRDDGVASRFSGINAAILNFKDADGVTRSSGGTAITSSDYGPYTASKAFDNNPDTLWHVNWQSGLITAETYMYEYVGYISPEPYELHSVEYKPIVQGIAQEWLSADIEYSDDGITWHEFGIIKPNRAPKDQSLSTVLVVKALAIDSLSVLYANNTKYLNIYTVDESGSISGQVQEKGLPIKAEVALHDRLTRKTVAIAWSDGGGNYSFAGLDKDREYYAEALHPTRKFNLVGQDGLRSGMTA